MTKKEDNKFEIEDIKDPLDEAESTEEDDLEEVVEDEEPKEDPVLDETDTNPAESEIDEQDELEKAVSEPEVPKEEKSKKIEKAKKDKKPFPWKTTAIIVITFLVTAALVLGGIYFYQKNKESKVTETPAPVTNVEVNVTKPVVNQKSVYVTAADGLNLRKEPLATAEKLTVIPFGTKLDITETQGTWFKTTYNKLTGWVDGTYTSSTNPLVYQNSEYKFQITFPSDWAGYKLFPIAAESTMTSGWYLGLPTTDNTYIASGVDKGYANMAAITVYTPTQWAAVQAEEGAAKPTLAAQNPQWVVAYSLPNGVMAKDLTKQASQTKDIVKTIKFY